MQKSTKRFKLFVFLTIAVIVLLLVISIVQIISINNKQREIARQRAEIERLNNELNYYESNENKDIDNPIIIEGEQA